MKEIDRGIGSFEKRIDKPHITYASLFLCLTAMVCFIVYFSLEYKKTADEINLEIKRIDLEMMDKKIRLEQLNLRSVSEGEKSEKDRDGKE
jgi:hypothetical protein